MASGCASLLSASRRNNKIKSIFFFIFLFSINSIFVLFLRHRKLQVAYVLGRIVVGLREAFAQSLHTSSKSRLALSALAKNPILMRMDSAMERADALHNPSRLAVLATLKAANLRQYAKFLEDNAFNVILARQMVAAVRRQRGLRIHECHPSCKCLICFRNFKCILKIIARPLISSIGVLIGERF